MNSDAEEKLFELLTEDVGLKGSERDECDIGGCERDVHETMSLSTDDQEYDLCRPCVGSFLSGLKAGKRAYQGTDTDRTLCPNCGEGSEFVQFATGEESTVATSPERIGDGLLELRTCNCGAAIENVLTVDEQCLIDVAGDS